MQCGAQPDEASNTLTRRPATYNRILDSRTRQPADALIIVDVKILEHRLNANILRSSCPYQLVAKPVLTVLLTKKLASMVALLACRSGVRTFAAACGWRTSLACFGGTLLCGQVASCLASFRRGHCAAKSGARQVVLRAVLTDIRRHCRCHCPAIAGTLRGHDARNFAGFLAGCFAPIARPSRGTPRSFRRAIGEP